MKQFPRFYFVILIVALLAFSLFSVVPVSASYQHEDNVSPVAYTGASWSVQSGAGASGTYTQSNANGDYFEFPFTGSFYEVHGFRASVAGIGNVYIDGVLQGTFDGYAPSNVPQDLLYSGWVAYGVHTLKVEVTNTKNASSGDYYIFFDFLIIDDASPTATAGPTETFTDTPSPTITETNTPSLTPSVTNTPSLTPSVTNTPSLTPSVTNTPTITPTYTLTPVVRDVGYLEGYKQICVDPVHPLLVVVLMFINMLGGLGFMFFAVLAGPDGICYQLSSTGSTFYILQAHLYSIMVFLLAFFSLMKKDTF